MVLSFTPNTIVLSAFLHGAETITLLAHIENGAKKVIVSAPCKNADKTIVFGVNENIITKEDKIISAASCTTNCLAPVTSVLDKNFEIEKGFMTTIHSFTGDQSTVDQTHTDLRRARAASTAMIPTTTGAAKALGLVLPSLKGKLDGTAIRVPTPNVSLIDFTFTSKKETSVDKINKIMIAASKTKELKNILTIN
jgi:glyceraldehyde 3-phosphate dehydrogenase